MMRINVPMHCLKKIICFN